ncbi:DMP19 family protein [Tropicimonas marinistellae]|uniref:DMP19 family protein n=1 Tax=Tropicimonas marinistellae TaxID=1739787 RepID=UPI000835E7CA|nr:DUF4375 domain-containing protein [Tropicimonas marinistellae]
MLQKLFSRLRPATETDVHETTERARQLRHIVVPKSALDTAESDPFRIVGAVVDYVNHLVSSGHYTRDEIPPEAIQAYHCDYYYAQVTNGGHAQFVGNSLRNLEFVLSDIDEGLRTAGADDYLAIFAKMGEWILANPKDARKQTGFEGGIAPELEALDAPFYALDDNPGMTEYLARWISGLPNLKIVEDDALPTVMREITARHSDRDPEAIARDIARISMQLTDPTHLGFGLVGASKSPPEPLVQLGGASQMRISEHREDQVFVLRTVAGPRFGVQSARGFELFERIEGDNSHLPRLSSPQDLADVSLDEVLSFHPPTVGPRLAYVPRKMAEVAALVCERFRAAAAIDLMLRSLPRTPEIDYVSVRSVGKGSDGKIGTTILVVADKARTAFCAVIEAGDAKLLAEPSHDVLVTATRAEIEEHARTYMFDG